MATAMRMRIGELQEKELKRERERNEEGEAEQRGSKENEQQAKRITIFSPFVFVPRNTFCCHNSPQGRGAREIEAKDPKYTQRGGGECAGEQGKSRAHSEGSSMRR